MVLIRYSPSWLTIVSSNGFMFFIFDLCKQSNGKVLEESLHYIVQNWS